MRRRDIVTGRRVSQNTVAVPAHITAVSPSGIVEGEVMTMVGKAQSTARSIAKGLREQIRLAEQANLGLLAYLLLNALVEAEIQSERVINNKPGVEHSKPAITKY